MNKKKRAESPQAVVILKKLKKMLLKKTYAHTKGTAKMAVKLAALFKAEKHKAELAGLLHDCAKDISPPEMPEAIKKYAVKITGQDRKIPAIWHGPVGEQIARKEFGIKDIEILYAVRKHSTGSARMGKIGKIVYAADFIEHGRGYEESRKLRKLLGK